MFLYYFIYALFYIYISTIINSQTAWVNGSKITGTDKGYSQGVTDGQSSGSHKTITKQITFVNNFSGYKEFSISIAGNFTKFAYIKSYQHQNSNYGIVIPKSCTKDTFTYWGWSRENQGQTYFGTVTIAGI